jgi:xylitol oxidase
MDETTRLHNWAGNLTYQAKQVFYPESVDEVRQIVRNCSHLTAIGSRHSFNTIADNTANQISLEKMQSIMSLDRPAGTVTIEAGIRYSQLAPYLYRQGFALQNMASLPHITVAGACATATHGSGITTGNLATAVVALEFVDAYGEVVTLSKQDGDEFYGAVVGLGALGIVTRLTLAIQPAFDMEQRVYLNLPMSELKDNFDDLQSRGYSVSLFTDWKTTNINEVWVINKTGTKIPPAHLDMYGAKPATAKTHPVPGLPVDTATDQLGIPGPWFERMPHFKIGFQPSVGNELQSEYYVPIEYAYAAMQAVQELHTALSPHLFISEVRTVGADGLWMSPCYKRERAALHFTWRQDPEVTGSLLPLIEEKLAPYDPVPHWGKLFAMDPGTVQSRYERLGDFKQLAGKYDPNGKFRNQFLTSYLYS